LHPLDGSPYHPLTSLISWHNSDVPPLLLNNSWVDTRIWTLYLVTHTKKWTCYNHLKINDYLNVIFSTFFFLCVCDQIEGQNPCVHQRVSPKHMPVEFFGPTRYMSQSFKASTKTNPNVFECYKSSVILQFTMSSFCSPISLILKEKKTSFEFPIPRHEKSISL